MGLDEVIHHLLDGPFARKGPGLGLCLRHRVQKFLEGGEACCDALVDLGRRETGAFGVQVLLRLDLLGPQSHEAYYTVADTGQATPSLGRAELSILGHQATFSLDRG